MVCPRSVGSGAACGGRRTKNLQGEREKEEKGGKKEREKRGKKREGREKERKEEESKRERFIRPMGVKHPLRTVQRL